MTRGAALLTLALVASPLASANATPTPGDVVCARWRDQWYLATIVRAGDGGFDVLYGDADKATLGQDELLPLSQNPGFKRGERVLAIWQAGVRFFPGVVRAVAPRAYEVQWDDGSPASWVPAIWVTRGPAFTGAKPGRVLVAQVKGAWHRATVVERKGADAYEVLLANGGRAAVSAAELIDLPATPAFEPGDAVLAADADDALFLPATVSEVKPLSFLVKWQNGQAPSWVPAGRIVSQP